MPVQVALGSVAVLIVVALAAPFALRRPLAATRFVYAACALVALVLLATAGAALLGRIDISDGRAHV
jgi:hypothetical protein